MLTMSRSSSSRSRSRNNENGDRVMTPAQYEAHLWTQMIQTMGFLLIVYLPLQIGAILLVRHWLARLAAGLPIVLMLPVMITGFQTKTYADGSLFGLGLIVISVPVMVYLAAFFFGGLAVRSANAKKSELGESTNANGTRLILTLLTIAAIVVIGIIFVLTPR